MVLTYQVVGDELLTKQIVRLSIESLLFIVLITGDSKIASFLLIGFNMLSGVVGYGKIHEGSLFMILTIGHFIVAVGVYLNVWIDEQVDYLIKSKEL